MSRGRTDRESRTAAGPLAEGAAPPAERDRDDAAPLGQSHAAPQRAQEAISSEQAAPKPGHDSKFLDRTLVQSDEERDHARRRSQHEQHPPGQVPGYEIESCIGSGAYGEVWKAVEENTGRQVAIKFFSNRGGLDWPLLTREVGKLAQLYAAGPIVRLLKVGWDATPPYYVMEYLEGGSLADRLRAGALPAAEAVRLSREVAEALVYVHGKAILHCDLKPANVLLDAQGHARLADFGQARLGSENGPAMGTLFFMAPEQAQPQAVPDARWDVYALGALMYAMLTGRPPHASDRATQELKSSGDVGDRLRRYRELVFTSPSPSAHRRMKGVDRPLAAIVDRCLKRNPAERFAGAQEVLAAFHARDRQRAHRPTLAFGIVGPALLLLIMLTLGYVVRRNAASQAEVLLRDQIQWSAREAAGLVARAIDRNLLDVESRVEYGARASPRLAERLVELQGRSGAWSARHEAAMGGPLVAALPQPDPVLQNLVVELFEQHATVGYFYSWLVADAQGVMLARRSIQPHTDDDNIGYSYADREWFTGLPETADRRRAPPRTQTGISEAIISRITEEPLVGFATPIWAPPQEGRPQEVVGVLFATISAETFNNWITVPGAQTGDDPGSGVILIDHRGHIIHHPLARYQLHRNESGDLEFSHVAEIDALAEALERGSDRSDRLRYSDEGIGTFLAGFSNVGDRGWTVVFQQNEQISMRPISNLLEQFDTVGRVAVIVTLVMIALLWAMLWRVVREKPMFAGSRAHGSTSEGNGK